VKLSAKLGIEVSIMTQEIPGKSVEKKEELPFFSYSETRKREGKEGPNQDAILIDDEHGLYGVFDGMGGHKKGEVASAIARDLVAQAGRVELDLEEIGRIPDKLANMLWRAHADIIEATRKERKPDAEGEEEGMGTTASVVKAFIRPDGARFAAVATVGDSPVYIWRAHDKRLEMVGGGDDALDGIDISDEEREEARKKVHNAVGPEDLSGDDNASFLWAQRNMVSQYLGWQKFNKGTQEYELVPINPRTCLVELGLDDEIYIFSDGITDNVPEDDVAKMAGVQPSIEQKGRILIGGAMTIALEGKEKHFRAKKDDKTVIIIGAKK
jgi:serine/threonine protein phosphatase PrpC